MAKTSTESIKCGKRSFEPDDFRRMFKYLPINVLRRYTNIEQLIIAEYMKKHKKPPPGIHINKAIEKYHKQLTELDDWKGTILAKLNFNWPSGEKIHASIWTLPKSEQDNVHLSASDHQKQFIYLPLHVFVEATNAEELMYEEAVKAKQDLNNVKLFVQGLHPYLHKVEGWRRFMKKLKFNTGETIDTTEDEQTESAIKAKRSEPVASTSKQAHDSKTLQRGGQAPSTSKQADSVPSTSKQACPVSTTSKTPVNARISPRTARKQADDDENQKRTAQNLKTRQSESNHTAVKRGAKENVVISTLKNANPIPSTSRESNPVASTSKTLEKARSSRRTVQKQADDDENQKRTAQNLETRQSESNLAGVKRGAKENIVTSTPKNANPISSTSKLAKPVPSPKKTPEIVRSPQKTTGKQADKRTVQDLRTRQSESNHANAFKRATRSNECDSAQETGVSLKRKMVQSTLPGWMDTISPIANDDAGQSELPKRARTQHLGAIIRKQNNEPSIEKSNLADKSKGIAASSTPVENDENNERASTNRIAQIAKEVTSAQKNKSPLKPVDQNTPEKSSTEASSENRLVEQRREYNAEDRERELLRCEPSDFQREIQAMSYEDFVSKTNIKEIIKRTHSKGPNDISQEDMDIRLKYYYDFRMQTSKWHLSPIKNLDYIECKCKRLAKQSRANEQPANASDSNLSRESSTKSGSSHQNVNRDPSDFQQEIIAMNFETFVNKTNIKNLVEQDYNKQFKGTRKITPEMLEFGLKSYYNLRLRHQKWHVNSLKNLKYLSCDCQRNKTFANKSIGTDPVLLQNRSVQYDDGTKEHQTLQSKLASLAIHRITDAEIIHIQSEIQSSESSEVSSSQNNSMDINQSAQGEGTQLTLTGSVTTSGQEAPPQSQQIMSVEQVRMSELMLRSPPQPAEHQNPQNPIETEEPTENSAVEMSENQEQEMQMNDVEEAGEQDTTHHTVGTSQFRIKPSSELQSSGSVNHTNQVIHCVAWSLLKSPDLENSNNEQPEIKDEPESLEYHLGDDSDVQYVSLPEQLPIEISDFLTTQEQFERVDSEPLIIVLTQPVSSQHASEQANEYTTEHANEHSSEYINEHVNQQTIEEANREADRQQLIRTLEGSPTIEDSEESVTVSSFKHSVNIQTTNNPVPARAFAAKRLSNTPASMRPKPATKKRRTSKEEDPLSNILVPKYNYKPLEFYTRSGLEAARDQARNERPAQIEESQPSPDSNYVIDESSSTEETNNSGMLTDSCVVRANLLNHDNTLFLNINTQIMTNSDGATSSQLNQPTVTTNASIVQPNQAEPLPEPGPSRLSAFNDKTEFLHYIDIQSVSSNVENVILPNGERSNQLNIETTLKHQCNGANRIVVHGNAIKLIMNMNDEEWNALHAILSALKKYRYDAKSRDPTNDTILHRTIYFLFELSSKISNVHIAYGDQDLDTARVFHKPYRLNENVTEAIDPYVLSMMKAKAQENQTYHTHNSA